MDLEAQGSTEGGTSRRKFLRNAGIAGGVAWAAPQIINATPAFAQASPLCITIDPFNTPHFVGTPEIGDVDASSERATSALGGWQDLRVTRTAGSTSPLAVQLESGGGQLAFSTTANTTGTGDAVYDGNDDPDTVDTFGLGGEDLSSASQFLLDVVQADFPVPISITVWDNDSQATVTLAAAPGTLSFPFASFTGIDFSNLGAIRLSFNNAGFPNADVTVENFRACP